MITYKAFDTDYKLLNIYPVYDKSSVELSDEPGSSHVKFIWEIIADVYFDRDGTGENMHFIFNPPYSESDLEMMHEFVNVIFTEKLI